MGYVISVIGNCKKDIKHSDRETCLQKGHFENWMEMGGSCLKLDVTGFSNYDYVNMFVKASRHRLVERCAASCAENLYIEW